MKLSVVIEKLQAELAQAGDRDVADIDLPPLPEDGADEALCIDLRYEE
jgi:hypothetical protein